MRCLRSLRAISGVVGLALVMTSIITTMPRSEKATPDVAMKFVQAASRGPAEVPVVKTSRSLKRIEITVAATKPAISSEAATEAKAKKPALAKAIRRYTVKGGDTLSQIAVDHRLSSWHPLASANSDTVKNPNLIYIGQRLRVPSSGSATQTKPKTIAKPQTARKTPAVMQHLVVGDGSPQIIARQLLASRGWSSQWSCLNSLINRESGWNVHADNPSSDAYGIPQALPGSKMASAGSNWHDSARTQLEWMMGYIHARYGNPCGAWGHSQNTGWY